MSRADLEPISPEFGRETHLISTSVQSLRRDRAAGSSCVRATLNRGSAREGCPQRNAGSYFGRNRARARPTQTPHAVKPVVRPHLRARDPYRITGPGSGCRKPRFPPIPSSLQHGTFKSGKRQERNGPSSRAKPPCSRRVMDCVPTRRSSGSAKCLSTTAKPIRPKSMPRARFGSRDGRGLRAPSCVPHFEPASRCNSTRTRRGASVR